MLDFSPMRTTAQYVKCLTCGSHQYDVLPCATCERLKRDSPEHFARLLEQASILTHCWCGHSYYTRKRDPRICPQCGKRPFLRALLHALGVA